MTVMFPSVTAPGDKTEWLAACAARLAEQGFVGKWAAAHAEAAWLDCVETHGSEAAALANCPPTDAADECVKFWGCE